MFTLFIFTFWFASAILILAGYGRHILEQNRVQARWLAVLMIGIAGVSVLIALYSPIIRGNFGDLVWSVVVVAVFLVRGHKILWWGVSLMAMAVSVMRVFGPINPHRVVVVDWMIWEILMVGLMVGLLVKDPFLSALSAAMVTILSSLIHTMFGGYMPIGTTRDLAYSLGSTLMAWNIAWVLNWVHVQWRRRVVNS